MIIEVVYFSTKKIDVLDENQPFQTSLLLKRPDLGFNYFNYFTHENVIKKYSFINKVCIDEILTFLKVELKINWAKIKHISDKKHLLYIDLD